MPPRDWRLRVADILSAVERIGRYTSGLSFEQFAQDERTVEAVCFALVVIGEAATHVLSEVQMRGPALPWRKMQAMRNVAAHEYFGLDVRTQMGWPRFRCDVAPAKAVEISALLRARPH